MGKPPLVRPELVSQHAKSCKLKGDQCALCHWHRQKRTWRTHLKSQKWLQISVQGKGKLQNARVGCAFCALAGTDGPWAKFEMDPYDIAPWKLKKHEACKSHVLAEEAAKKNIEGSAASSVFAPPMADFKDTFSKMKQGGSSRDGGSSSDKKHKMRWAISEAVLEKSRQWLKDAQCISLMRDERKGRLLIRFRACLRTNLEVVQGVIGLRSTEGYADNLAQCTIEAVREFCQPMKCPPRHCPASEAKYDEELEKSIRDQTTIVVTDAAANELLASDILRGRRPYASTGLRASDFPGIKIVARDIAHASTRLLSRSFDSHSEIQSLMEEYISGKDSFAQKLRHSTLYSTWWKEILEKKNLGNEVEESNAGSSGSMAAAKHRFSSFLQPLGRICKQMRHMLELSHKIANMRDSSGVWASKLLKNFCGYKAVLLGLAADAAAICNDFTRFCDSESESDISELTMEARKFMLSAQALFLQEQVFALPTFTKSVVDVAARGPFQILVDGRAVEVKITEDDKRRAVQVFKDAFLNFGLLLFYSFNLVMLFHIAVVCVCQEWVTTAEATLTVEFPSWDFLGAFEVFHPCVGKDGKQLEANLGKLAQVLEVDRDELKRQYVGMLPAKP